MAINSMALRRKKHKDMRPQSMKSAEIGKSPIISANTMKQENLDKQMGMQSSIGMPACKRVQP